MRDYYGLKTGEFNFPAFLEEVLGTVPGKDELLIYQFSKTNPARKIESPVAIAGPGNAEAVNNGDLSSRLRTPQGDTDFLEAIDRSTGEINQAIVWLLTDNINDPTGGGGDQATREFYDKLKDPQSSLRRVFVFPVITRWTDGKPASGLMLYAMLFSRSSNIPDERINAFDKLVQNDALAKITAGYNKGWPHIPMWIKPLDEGTVRIEPVKVVDRVPTRALAVVRDEHSDKGVKIAGKGFDEGQSITAHITDSLVIRNYLHPYDIISAKLGVTSTLLSTEEGFRIPEEQQITPAEVSLSNALRSDGSIPIELILKIPKHSIKTDYLCMFHSSPKPDPSHYEDSDYGRLQYEVDNYRHEHCLASIFQSEYKIKGFLHLNIPRDPQPEIRLDGKYKELLLAISGGQQLSEVFQPQVEKINEKFRDRYALPVEIVVGYGISRFIGLFVALGILLLLPLLLFYLWLRRASYSLAIDDQLPVNIFVSPLRKYSVDAVKELDERKAKRLGNIKMNVLRKLFFEAVPEVSVNSSKRRTANLSAKGTSLDLEYKLPRPDQSGRQLFKYTLRFSRAGRGKGRAVKGKTPTSTGKYY
jgi:hypothetical protein